MGEWKHCQLYRIDRWTPRQHASRNIETWGGYRGANPRQWS